MRTLGNSSFNGSPSLPLESGNGHERRVYPGLKTPLIPRDCSHPKKVTFPPNFFFRSENKVGKEKRNGLCFSVLFSGFMLFLFFLLFGHRLHFSHWVNVAHMETVLVFTSCSHFTKLPFFTFIPCLYSRRSIDIHTGNLLASFPSSFLRIHPLSDSLVRFIQFPASLVRTKWHIQ